MGTFQTKHLSWGATNEVNPAAGSVNPGAFGIYRSSMVTAPNQSVTVINEINTESGSNPLLPTRALLGYAYILTIGYGTPIVSYKDWSTDADCYGSTIIDDHNFNYHISKLIWCHKFLCTGDMSNEYNTPNGHIYSFQKNGPNPTMVFMNSDKVNPVEANAPTTIPEGTVLVDYTDHDITATVTNGKIVVNVPANKNGRGYLVMAAAGIIGSFTPGTSTVTQEWEGNKDLSIPPASNTQQEVCRIWVDNNQSITSALLDYDTSNWAEATNLHIEINKTSLDNKTHTKVASRTFNNNQKGQTLTYTTAATGGPGYYSVWIKGNNLPDSVSNWWFRLQNTYKASQTAPESFNDTIPTLVKARKVFIPDTIETNTEKLSIYPNPAHNTITAEYILSAATDVRIRIIDMTGKTMFSSTEGKRVAGKGKATINITGWVSGVYFLQ
ncbi:MAG: T9SS type A sorting domain-containing protein, partial [Sphingobacteriales bacterium]